MAIKLQTLGWQIEFKPRDGSYFGGGNGISYNSEGGLVGVGDLRRTNFAMGE